MSRKWFLVAFVLLLSLALVACGAAPASAPCDPMLISSDAWRFH